MPSKTARKQRGPQHSWTPFEQRALLCLICRQIPVITDDSPSPTAGRRVSKSKKPEKPKKNSSSQRNGTFDLISHAASKHAHREVADLLNRALNGRSYELDISTEEVGAMMMALMGERAHAVRFLERQGVARLTRSVRRVWERGAKSARNGAVAGGAGERGADKEMVDIQGDDDPWGEGAGVASTMVEDDPWGDTVVPSATLTRDDPWGDEVATSVANMQNADEMRGVEQAAGWDSNVQDETNPWASSESTFVNNTSSDDPWATDSAAAAVATNTTVQDDPWASWPVMTSPIINTTTATNHTTSDDPWATDSSPVVNTSTAKADDPWASWPMTDSSAIKAHTTIGSDDDPWAIDPSLTDATSDRSKSHPSSTQATQDTNTAPTTANPSITTTTTTTTATTTRATTPTHEPSQPQSEQSPPSALTNATFPTHLNPARLAMMMLDLENENEHENTTTTDTNAAKEFEDRDGHHHHQYHGEGTRDQMFTARQSGREGEARGGNAIVLPFNRLAGRRAGRDGEGERNGGAERDDKGDGSDREEGEVE